MPELSKQRSGSRIVPNRAPYVQPSPMPSMMLDRSQFGGPSKSVYGNPGRSRYQAGRNILPEEDEADIKGKGKEPISMPREESGLDHEVWETSPSHSMEGQRDIEGIGQEGLGEGVLGLLYQFQKTRTDGRAGVNL